MLQAVSGSLLAPVRSDRPAAPRSSHTPLCLGPGLPKRAWAQPCRLNAAAAAERTGRSPGTCHAEPWPQAPGSLPEAADLAALGAVSVPDACQSFAEPPHACDALSLPAAAGEQGHAGSNGAGSARMKPDPDQMSAEPFACIGALALPGAAGDLSHACGAARICPDFGLMAAALLARNALTLPAAAKDQGRAGCAGAGAARMHSNSVQMSAETLACKVLTLPAAAEEQGHAGGAGAEEACIDPNPVFVSAEPPERNALPLPLPAADWARSHADGAGAGAACRRPSPSLMSAEPPACNALPLPAAAGVQGHAGGTSAGAAREHGASGSPNPEPSSVQAQATAHAPGPAAAALGQAGSGGAPGAVMNLLRQPQAAVRATLNVPPNATIDANAQPSIHSPPSITASASRLAGSGVAIGPMLASAQPHAIEQMRSRDGASMERPSAGHDALAAGSLLAPSPGMSGYQEEGGAALQEPIQEPATDPAEPGQVLAANRSGHVAAEPHLTGSAQGSQLGTWADLLLHARDQLGTQAPNSAETLPQRPRLEPRAMICTAPAGHRRDQLGTQDPNSTESLPQRLRMEPAGVVRTAPATQLRSHGRLLAASFPRALLRVTAGGAAAQGSPGRSAGLGAAAATMDGRTEGAATRPPGREMEPARDPVGEQTVTARAARAARRHSAPQHSTQHAQSTRAAPMAAPAANAAGNDAPEAGCHAVRGALARAAGAWFLPAPAAEGQELVADTERWHGRIAVPASMGGQAFSATGFLTNSGRRGRLFPIGACQCKLLCHTMHASQQKAEAQACCAACMQTDRMVLPCAPHACASAPGEACCSPGIRGF